MFILMITSLAIVVSAEALDIPPIIQGPTRAPLGCHMRVYTYRIIQSDSRGHECWDHVSVWSCWGRCDSNEISDWKFPYKRSHHPVCVHAGRSKSVAILRHCHPLADESTKRYEYMEAIGCRCQVIKLLFIINSMV